MSFLPGMFPAGAMSSVEVLTSIVLANSTETGDNFLNFTGLVQAGDLLVYGDWARTATVGPSAVTPSGFTLISNVGIASDIRQILSYKIATGSEGFVVGMDSAEELKVGLVFRGNIPFVGVTAAGVAGEATANNPTAQVVPAAAGTPPLIVLGAYGGALSIEPRTFTPAADGDVESFHGSFRFHLMYKIYMSSPANVTVDMDDEGTRNSLQSCYLQLTT